MLRLGLLVSQTEKKFGIVQFKMSSFKTKPIPLISELVNL